jgi:hypothetical protein
VVRARPAADGADDAGEAVGLGKAAGLDRTGVLGAAGELAATFRGCS